MLSYIPHSRPTITQSDIDAVNIQIQSNLLSNGARVLEFENLISEFNNVRYSICTSNGSTALQVILSSLNLPKKSEVILPSYVCNSVYNSILAQGFLPVLCDIEQDWVMTISTVKSKISSETSAIILVHTFGIDAWDEGFSDLNLPIIEDFCQGFALQNLTKRELKGDAGFCSFNATKCLTTGEGGAIITNCLGLFNQCKKTIEVKKVSCIFSDFQASIGISQIQQYTTFILRRQEISESYFDGIKNKVYTGKMNLLREKSVFFRFLIFGEIDADATIIKAQRKGIAIRRGVDKMLHNVYLSNSGSYRNTENVFQSTLSLPIYPTLKEEEQLRIINFINAL